MKGRIATMIALGAAFVLFAPSAWADWLALTTLRAAEYYWVVGVVFLLATGLVVVRIGEFAAAARAAYREDDDLRDEVGARNEKELAVLRRAVESGNTTLLLEPGLLEEIRPLVALGLLQEVTKPQTRANIYGTYLVPMHVFRILKARFGENAPDDGRVQKLRRALAEGLSRVTVQVGPSMTSSAAKEPQSSGVRVRLISDAEMQAIQEHAEKEGGGET